MNSRALLLAAALAATLLAGCGGDDESDAAEARTEACRAYLVGGGAGDEEFAASVSEVMAGIETGTGSGYEMEPIKAVLKEIRVGAAAAGATEELTDRDFKVFAQVAAATADLDRALRPNSDTETINREDVDALTAAVKGVHGLCS